MTEWSTIDTAPKDGTRILTYGFLHEDGTGESEMMTISKWGLWGWYSNELGSHEPHSWQHLPDPPTP